jgi:signal peptidase II
MRIVLLAVVVSLLDYWSKARIQSLMQEGDSIPLVSGVFHITYVLNPGAAFGILENQRVLFLAVTAVRLLAFLYFLPRLEEQERSVQFGISLFVGGAVGNLIDRVQLGEVVDFLDFRVWPVFNLADIAITVGAAFILWNILRQKAA